MSKVTEWVRHEARVVITTPPGFNALNLISMGLWVLLAWTTGDLGFLSGFVVSLPAFVWGQHQQVKIFASRARTAVIWAQIEAREAAREQVLRQLDEEEF